MSLVLSFVSSLSCLVVCSTFVCLMCCRWFSHSQLVAVVFVVVVIVCRPLLFCGWFCHTALFVVVYVMFCELLSLFVVVVVGCRHP